MRIICVVTRSNKIFISLLKKITFVFIFSITTYTVAFSKTTIGGKEVDCVGRIDIRTNDDGEIMQQIKSTCDEVLSKSFSVGPEASASDFPKSSPKVNLNHLIYGCDFTKMSKDKLEIFKQKILRFCETSPSMDVWSNGGGHVVTSSETKYLAQIDLNKVNISKGSCVLGNVIFKGPPTCRDCIIIGLLDLNALRKQGSNPPK